MTKRVKGHIGFFLAGFVLMAVVANIYLTYERTEARPLQCQSTSTQ